MARTWKHDRGPASEDQFQSRDNSPSTYEMSIAAYLVADEWDDQSIVDVCIAWRQLHGLTIPKYASKYLATLRNALKTNRFKTSERQLKGAYKQGERKFQIWNLLVEAGPLAPAEIAAKLDMNPP